MSLQAFDEFIMPIVRQAREIHRVTGFRAKIEVTLHADIFVLAMAENLRYRDPKSMYESVEIHNGVIVHCSQEGRVL